MKYLKHYKESNDIAEICSKYNIKNWSLEDGKVNVDSDVSLYTKDIAKDKLLQIPLPFGKVSGNFNCSFNQIISLEGAPEYVGGYLYCFSNGLVTLEDGPEYIGRDFHCYNNKLSSLKYGPKYVGNNMNCSHNQLTSLDGLPDYIGGNFDCSHNSVYDVYNIDCIFTMSENPVYFIYKYITKNFELIVSIDYFNDSRILVGKDIYISRFKVFLEEYGLDSNINVEELIEAGYTIK